MKRLVFRPQSVPVALFLLAVLSYGMYIPFLGLVGDDWPYLWVYHTAGAGGYASFVAGDRPLSAWVYVLFTPILGETPGLYHASLLMLRWLSAVGLWWVLRLVWPQHERPIAWVSFLFLVYPGFKQQFIPLEFILHFVVLDLFLLSLGAMVLAVRQVRWRWALLAVAAAGAAGMFSIEYFVGLELLRPILLWVVLGQPGLTKMRRAGQVLLYWLPNLLVLAAFGVWRVFIFKFPSYRPTLLENFRQSPARALFSTALRVLSDLREVTLGAWRQVLKMPEQPEQIAFYAVLVVLTLALALLYLLRLRSGEDRDWVFTPLLLGGFALFVCGWPFWVPEIPVELTFPWDRPTLAFMLGVSLVLVGLVEMFQARFRPYLLALLLALAVGLHYQNAMLYRGEWETLRQYYWQMSWRIPGLRPGTSILGEQIPLYYHADSSLTPPLNWIYAPESAGMEFRYKLFDLDARMNKENSKFELTPDKTIEHTYRGYRFAGSTSQALLVYYNPKACLRVLSQEDRYLPDLPKRTGEHLEISNLEQIVVDANPAARPPAVLGSEPAHGWCYYFEKADLARQQTDWAQVAALGKEAFAAGLFASDLSELLPFVQGFAQTGDWKEAGRLSDEVNTNSSLRPALCSVWAQINRKPNLSAEEEEKVKTIRKALECPATK